VNILNIIEKKKNCKKLTREELDFFIKGVCNETIPQYQQSALLMAICINGLDDEETGDLTMSMVNSGTVLDLSKIPGKKVDKHSTGGVSDTTSLIILPVISSLGLNVIKMSGKGLGHTGGTLDKLSSINGFNYSLSNEEAIAQVRNIGAAILGQTATLAPADKYLYALRDVTATVDSIPLIASSIMSKKIAGGADALVLDVKCGSGAFMKTEERATALAEAMTKIGKHVGRKTIAVITDMNEPLGLYVGNSLEVREAVEILNGMHKNSRLYKVALTLGAYMLIAGEKYDDFDLAYEAQQKAIESGRAREMFKKLIKAQGGDERIVDDPELLETDQLQLLVKAESDGYIYSVKTDLLGSAGMCIGSGRKELGDEINLKSGFIMKVTLGDRVKKGDVIAEIYSDSKENSKQAAKIISSSITVSQEMPEKNKLVKKIII